MQIVRDGKTFDVLVCGTCGKTFERRHCQTDTRIVTNTYCGQPCARKAAGQRWKASGGDTSYARFRRFRESMI